MRMHVTLFCPPPRPRAGGGWGGQLRERSCEAHRTGPGPHPHPDEAGEQPVSQPHSDRRGDNPQPRLTEPARDHTRTQTRRGNHRCLNHANLGPAEKGERRRILSNLGLAEIGEKRRILSNLGSAEKGEKPIPRIRKVERHTTEARSRPRRFGELRADVTPPASNTAWSPVVTRTQRVPAMVERPLGELLPQVTLPRRNLQGQRRAGKANSGRERLEPKYGVRILGKGAHPNKGTWSAILMTPGPFMRHG